MYSYIAQLEHIVDGDTVDIIIDLGFTITTKQRVRLVDLNAPERFTTEGKASTEAVTQWFADNPGPYYIESSKPGGGDKYGRYLARIYSDVTKQSCLNDYLVAHGFAKTWDGTGTKPV